VKLLSAAVLMAVFLAFSATARAEPLEVIGSVSSHPVLLAGEARIIDGMGDVGAQVEITTTQNVLDPDVGMLLYSGNPVGSGPSNMAPLGRYVVVTLSSEAASSLGRMIVTMPYSVAELRNAGVVASTLKIYFWDERKAAWRALQTDVSVQNEWSGMLRAVTPGPGLFSIYGQANKTESNGSSACSSSAACSDWSACSEGWKNKTCHSLDTCTGERSDIVETEECSPAASGNTDSSITGMLAGRGDAMIMLSVLAVVFILAAIVELRRGK
jgi:hypothetical protein